jgi:hypothetical protein
MVEYHQHRAKHKVRQRGASRDDCLRHFLRALTQEVAPFTAYPGHVPILEKLKRLGVSLNQLKNARRTPFVAQVVFNNTSNRRCIRELLRALGYASSDRYRAWIDLLVHPGVGNPGTLFEE